MNPRRAFERPQESTIIRGEDAGLNRRDLIRPQDVTEYCATDKNRMYFNPQVREKINGISDDFEKTEYVKSLISRDRSLLALPDIYDDEESQVAFVLEVVKELEKPEH